VITVIDEKASNGGVDLNGANWKVVSETIRSRRSNLNVDLERPVPREVIDELVDLAVSAPNLYRTNPWRFVVLTGSARSRLGEIVAREVAKQPEVKEAFVERQRAQFLRAPTVLIVASAGDAEEATATSWSPSSVAARFSLSPGGQLKPVGDSVCPGAGTLDAVRSAIVAALGVAPAPKEQVSPGALV